MGKLQEEYEKRVKEVSDIREHLPVLKKYASMCNHVTEFGVRRGNSTYGLLSGKPSKMISYDIIFCQATVQISSICLDEGIDYKFIIGDTNNIEIESTDLLFIDTKHTYSQLINELNLHSGKVVKYIIMHDTQYFGLRDEDHFGLYDEARNNEGKLRLSVAKYFGLRDEGKLGLNSAKYFGLHDEVRNTEGKFGLNAAINDFLQSPIGSQWKIEMVLVNNNGLTILSRDEP